MPTTTPELSLYKYNTDTDGNMTYNITNSMNNNWDKIDTYCGNLSSNKADKTTVNAALDLKADTSTVNTALALKADKTVIHALKGYSDGGELLTDAEGLQDVKKYVHSTFDASKFTKIGSPTITDGGIVSGFEAQKYISCSLTPSTTSNIKIKLPSFTTGSDVTTMQIVITGSLIQQIMAYIEGSTSKFNIWLGNNDGSWSWSLSDVLNGVVTANTIYNIELEISDNVAKIYNNGSLVKTQNLTSFSWNVPSTINIGSRYSWNTGNPAPLLGSIDLKQFSITVDGVEVFSGNKTGIDTIKPDDYTVVGTPTISADGVASGFTTSNYLTSSTNITNQTDIVIKGSWVHTNSTDRQWLITIYNSSATNECIQILPNENGNVIQARICIGANTFGSINLTDKQVPKIIGKKYNFELTIKGTNATFTVNGVSNSRNDFYAFTSTNFNIGASINGSYPFKGLTDLNDLQVYINGNLVYQPCLKIPYTESAEKYGSKIVNAVYRDRVQDAWQQNYPQRYYILDEENGNYTLPAGEIYGMIESCLNVNNPTVAEKETVTAWSVPDYTSGIAINQSSFPYTAVSTGYIVGGITVGSAGTEGRNLLVNNGIILHVPVNGTRFYFLPVEKGDILSVNIAASVTASAYFYPAKGV